MPINSEQNSIAHVDMPFQVFYAWVNTPWGSAEAYANTKEEAIDKVRNQLPPVARWHEIRCERYILMMTF